MVGVITEWDILAHPVVTIRCFGWQVFFKAIAPWQSRTFLSLLRPVAFSRAIPSNVPAILKRCIGLELQAKRIYTALAKTFDDQELVWSFFDGLAKHEQYHADLLKLCRAAAIRSGWRVSVFNPWKDYLPRLEQQMDAVEAAVYEVDSVDAALRLVIQIESSEINNVFHAALAATDTNFVKKLRPFQKTMEDHMTYIVERIPVLSPKLMLDCRKLRARFPNVRA